MYETFGSILKGYECAEIDDTCNLNLHHSPYFEFRGEVFDPFLRCINGFRVRASNLDRPVIGDVNLRTSLFDDLADHLATRANDRTDLLSGNLDCGQLGRVGRKLFARFGDSAIHLIENGHARTLGLG